MENRPSAATKILCLTGVAAVVLAWIVIGVSWYLNPWFRFLEDAFSDLGVPENTGYWWVYDYGLIFVGLVIMVYGAYTYQWARHKPEALAAGYIVLAGVFLALIGVYPGGTRPHVFVSTWFFVQMDLALIPLTYSLWRNRGWGPAKILLALSVLAWPIFIAVEAAMGWPSVAAGEAYGIIVIDAVVVGVSVYQCRG